MSKVKLNPNAQKWVDELRSGKWKQGSCRLRNGDKLCCLGVAAELSGLPYDHSAKILTDYPEIMQWLGLKNGCGIYRFSSLTIDNDFGKTFPEIADIIEDHAIELGVNA